MKGDFPGKRIPIVNIRLSHNVLYGRLCNDNLTLICGPGKLVWSWWFREWLLTCSTPRLYLNQCWFIYQSFMKKPVGHEWIPLMMTSSNGNIFRVTGHLCGEFTGPGEFPTQRPVTRSFDVYFDLRLNKWLSKQSWGWWFETLSCSLWRHRNATKCQQSGSLSWYQLQQCVEQIFELPIIRDAMTFIWRHCHESHTAILIRINMIANSIFCSKARPKGKH